MYNKGQKVWTPEFGWVVYERALIATADTSYDSKLRPIKTSTILLDAPAPPPKVSVKEKNAILRTKALETAIANGFALHQERDACVWIEETHEDFSKLVSLVIKLGPTLVMVANASVANTRSVEMGNFVIPVSEETNDLKCNVSVPNCRELGDLQKSMRFNVHTVWTSGFGEVVIYSKALAKALGNAGFISERSLKKPFVEDEVI